MDVSPLVNSNTDMSAIQVDVLQKAIDVNQMQAIKIMESAMIESEKVTAQKTGIGNNLNISG